MNDRNNYGGVLKFALAGIFVLIVLAGFGAFLLYHNKDEIVRRGTENVLAYVLDVNTSVGSAKLNITGGSIEFTDIVIDNPEGFDSDYAMKFGQVHVDANLQSFRTNEPRIDLIRLAEADIKLEIKNKTTNLKQLIENAKSKTGAGAPAPEETEADPETIEESKKTYVIGLVELEQNQVGVVIPMMQGYTGNIPLPNLRITDLGKKTPAEALEEIFRQTLASILNANEGVIPANLLGDIRGTLDSIGQQLQGSLGNTEENLRRSGENIQQEAERLGGAVRGLFGDNNSEEQE